MVVSRGDLEDHLRGVCPLRHYSCPDCNKSGTYRYITAEHQRQCPEATVPCPNGCGFVPITRRLQANHCKVCPNQVNVPACECTYVCLSACLFVSAARFDCESVVVMTNLSVAAAQMASSPHIYSMLPNIACETLKAGN